MKPVDLMIETGEELYGKHWVNQLSDHLRISDVTIRYWANGKRQLPADHPIIDKMCDLVELKIARLINLKQKFLHPDENVVTLVSGKNSPQP